MKTTLINLTSRRKQSLQLLVNQSIRKGLDQKATFELFLQDLEKNKNRIFIKPLLRPYISKFRNPPPQIKKSHWNREIYINVELNLSNINAIKTIRQA